MDVCAGLALSKTTIVNPENWQKLNEIYFAALELDNGDERERFLAASCASDATLHREVKNLLAATELAQQKEFLAANALALSGGDKNSLSPLENSRFNSEKQIGNYRVVGELGHGGMGTVFRAVRSTDFTQQVAIKLIKGEVRSAEIVRRFELERQILASLNHPNIARLLDGGTTADGAPFLVMEYVEGVPVNEFCRARNLSLDERLELFRIIAGAVAYAHKNLVIHRDLKPSNILVTADGVPKLLDFGIAKLLGANESDGAQTATLLRMFTPDYASPEQARGEKLTTATDVYSLGVVFYELLTEQRLFSFGGKSYEEIIRSINETEPVRPSKAFTKNALSKQTSENQQNPKSKIQNPKYLAGDLDNIALKALRKEPEQRYSSVEQFAADVNRYLSNLPVLARPQTLSYRAGKYIKRHRTAVIAAALVLLSLVGGLSAAVWQAIAARRAQERAEARFNQVRKLANTILFDYHDGIAQLPGATKMREKMVVDSLDYLNNLSVENDNNSDLQREIVKAYRKVGDIQGSDDTGNLGQTKNALATYQKALQIQSALSAAHPNNIEDQKMLGNLSLDIGDQLLKVGDSTGAQNSYEKALLIFTHAAEESPETVKANSDLARALWTMAAFQNTQNEFDAALDKYGRAAAIYQKLSDADSANIKHARNLALTYKKMGAIKQKSNDYNAALEFYRQAAKIDARNAAAQPDDVSAQLDLSFTIASIASAMRDTGDFQSALDNYQQALMIRQKILSADADNSFAEQAVARAHREIGKIFLKLKKLDQARKHLRQALTIFQKQAASDAANVDKKKLVKEILELLKQADQ